MFKKRQRCRTKCVTDVTLNFLKKSDLGDILSDSSKKAVGFARSNIVIGVNFEKHSCEPAKFTKVRRGCRTLSQLFFALLRRIIYLNITKTDVLDHFAGMQKNWHHIGKIYIHILAD